jgi:hypothetical protein
LNKAGSYENAQLGKLGYRNQRLSLTGERAFQGHIFSDLLERRKGAGAESNRMICFRETIKKPNGVNTWEVLGGNKHALTKSFSA